MVGRPASATKEGRDHIRFNKLAEIKRSNHAELAANGKSEWTFALVESSSSGRKITALRRMMTQRIADLKNKTMEGTGRQWCRVDR
jgi:hypothetical protein